MRRGAAGHDPGMAEQRLRFSEHAIDRMLESEIEVDDVEAALAGGETIEDYDDGSRLVLGRSGVRPLHVVAADEDGVVTVVTVYEPDPARWDAALRERRRS
jgi:Domain of unknown function (DUF4258)